MKKLLILTFLGMLLSGTAGCKFFDCLFRGGPAKEPCQPTTVVAAPYCDPCGGGGTVVSSNCNSCAGGVTTTTNTLPGPAPTTYTPAK